MNFADLVQKTSNIGIFTPRFLSAGENLAQVRLQISRWVQDNRVIKLHKGLYTLAKPFRKVHPEPFHIANSLKQASYVSLQSALSHYGMIPEFVPSVTSVTTGRPQTIETPLGRFEFRHISKKYFWGYQQIDLEPVQTAFVARPEKALLDLIYLSAGGDKLEFIEELRLQNFQQINKTILREFAEKFQSPKLNRALENIEKTLAEDEGTEL